MPPLHQSFKEGGGGGGGFSLLSLSAQSLNQKTGSSSMYVVCSTQWMNDASPNWGRGGGGGGECVSPSYHAYWDVTVHASITQTKYTEEVY